MQALFKHAKNFAYKDDDREVLQGIYFDGQSGYITNTHLLIKVEKCASEKKIIHWKTWELIEGEYPNVDRVIPKEYKTSFTILGDSFRNWVKKLKAALPVAMDNRYNDVKFICEHGDVKLKSFGDGTVYEAFLCKVEKGVDFEPFWVNVKYLLDIFAFFKDCDATVIEFGINKPLSPIGLTTNAGVMAILTTIRPEREG